MKNGYKHIIWDWNGTLFNDLWLSIEIINNLLSQRGISKITKKYYLENFDFPVVKYYKRLGFDFQKESFEKVGTEFIVNYEKRRHEAYLHKEVFEVLSTVLDIGLTQSILSAYKQPTLDELVDYFDLKKYFIAVKGMDNHYAHSKIEMGKRWMEQLQCLVHEVLFVGDTVHDYEVANAIGADCVLIPGGHHPRWRLEQTKARVFNSIQNVLELL